LQLLWKTTEIGNSSFSDYLIETNHKFDTEPIDLLHECDNIYKLNTLYVFEIYINTLLRIPFFKGCKPITSITAISVLIL
jgi:hypothetical protein